MQNISWSYVFGKLVHIACLELFSSLSRMSYEVIFDSVKMLKLGKIVTSLKPRNLAYYGLNIMDYPFTLEVCMSLIQIRICMIQV